MILLMCCEAITYMGVDCNCIFVYPWHGLRLPAWIQKQNSAFGFDELGFAFCFQLSVLNHSAPQSWYYWCVVKLSRTWALIAIVLSSIHVHSSIHDMVCNCQHGFRNKTLLSVLMNLALLSVLNSQSLSLVHPSHDITDVLWSYHVHGRWLQLYLHLSLTWFEIASMDSETKLCFRFWWI